LFDLVKFSSIRYVTIDKKKSTDNTRVVCTLFMQFVIENELRG
jgi:hypothetical protein